MIRKRSDVQITGGCGFAPLNAARRSTTGYDQ